MTNATASIVMAWEFGFVCGAFFMLWATTRDEKCKAKIAKMIAEDEKMGLKALKFSVAGLAGSVVLMLVGLVLLVMAIKALS